MRYFIILVCKSLSDGVINGKASYKMFNAGTFYFNEYACLEFVYIVISRNDHAARKMC